MDFNEEFQQIQDIADRDFDLVYDNILHSDQPWVGLYAISFDRFKTEIDQVRVHEIIDNRYDDIIAAIRDPEQSEHVLGCLGTYTEFLSDEQVLEAIAHVIESNENVGQIIYNIRHVKHALEYPVLKTAILKSLHSNPKPWNIIGTVRDVPNIYNDERLIDFVVKYIQSEQSVWRIIAEINDIRSLTENEDVRQTITHRSNQIADEIRTSESKRWIVKAILATPELSQDTRIINAIKNSIESLEDHVGIIYEVQRNLRLSKEVDIQRAIASAIIDAEIDDVIKLIENISENRTLIESQYTVDAISTRMNEIREFILTVERPHNVVESIALVHQLVDDERIQDAIEERVDDIITGLQEVTPWWSSWYLFEKSIWISKLFKNYRFRKLVADYIVQEDEVGNLTDKIRQMPLLISDPIFREALLEAITKFTNPIWVITSVAEFYNISQDSDMEIAVKQRIPDIILLMEQDREASYLTHQISNSEYLMRFEQIHSALLEKIAKKPISWNLLNGISEEILELETVQNIIYDEIDNLCKILENNFGDAIPHVQGVFRASVVKESEKIKEILKDNSDDMTYELENYWDVWYSIFFLNQFMEIIGDSKLFQLVKGRVKDLAYAIKNRDDGWAILGLISCMPELFQHPEIIEAIIERLDSRCNPWEIFNADNIEILLENYEVMQTLRSKVDEFVFGITSTVDAFFIVTELDRLGLFKDDERIIQAIQRYQERFKI